ncbi:hypothetical protein QL285_058064 [Trifolium repens]|nr:hypothetical protein QL285_058064 [Trifolium repens]
MSFLLIQEDTFWRERAKTHWLRDGDLNTKFYHASATSRRKVNKITSLLDASDNLITNDIELCDVARDYFVDIFQRQNSVTEPVINLIDCTISPEDNNMLTAPFVIEEFKEAIFSMKPDKCPGPDGFNPGCRWRIGNGNNIPLWNENWLVDALPLEPVNDNDLLYSGFTVADLMENDSKEWNVRRISAMFDQVAVARILATPLYPSIIDDRRLWRGESKGMESSP